MKVHAVDGTYELFRAYYGAPPARSPDGREVGATRGLLRSLVQLLREPDVTHVGVAFDTVIESFRNDLFDGYKTGEGIEPELFEQFALAEEAVAALGLHVWSMVEFEADDALATAAHLWSGAENVEQVVLCTPDKDLAQCVRGREVVLLDRRRRRTYDDRAVKEKWGVVPESIPDYLALVGDTTDGIPGIPRWGARSSSAVLSHYRHLEQIPEDPAQWAVTVRGAAGLAGQLREHREEAMLYRILATLRTDVPIDRDVEGLRWGGPSPRLDAMLDFLGDDELAERVGELA